MAGHSSRRAALSGRGSAGHHRIDLGFRQVDQQAGLVARERPHVHFHGSDPARARHHGKAVGDFCDRADDEAIRVANLQALLDVLEPRRELTQEPAGSRDFVIQSAIVGLPIERCIGKIARRRADRRLARWRGRTSGLRLRHARGQCCQCCGREYDPAHGISPMPHLCKNKTALWRALWH